jgi:hypothetical protein
MKFIELHLCRDSSIVIINIDKIKTVHAMAFELENKTSILGSRVQLDNLQIDVSEQVSQIGNLIKLA